MGVFGRVVSRDIDHRQFQFTCANQNNGRSVYDFDAAPQLSVGGAFQHFRRCATVHSVAAFGCYWRYRGASPATPGMGRTGGRRCTGPTPLAWSRLVSTQRHQALGCIQSQKRASPHATSRRRLATWLDSARTNAHRRPRRWGVHRSDGSQPGAANSGLARPRRSALAGDRRLSAYSAPDIPLAKRPEDATHGNASEVPTTPRAGTSGLTYVALCILHHDMRITRAPKSRMRLVAALALAAALLLAVAATVSAAAPPAPGPSTAFRLTGRVAHPKWYRLADLKALPAHTASVSFQGPGGIQHHQFTGALLNDLVTAAEPKYDTDRKNDFLRWSARVRHRQLRGHRRLRRVQPSFRGKTSADCLCRQRSTTDRHGLCAPGGAK